MSLILVVASVAVALLIGQWDSSRTRHLIVCFGYCLLVGALVVLRVASHVPPTWGVVLMCCTATVALLDGVRTLRTPDRPNEERACDR